MAAFLADYRHHKTRVRSFEERASLLHLDWPICNHGIFRRIRIGASARHRSLIADSANEVDGGAVREFVEGRERHVACIELKKGSRKARIKSEPSCKYIGRSPGMLIPSIALLVASLEGEIVAKWGRREEGYATLRACLKILCNVTSPSESEEGEICNLKQHHRPTRRLPAQSLARSVGPPSRFLNAESGRRRRTWPCSQRRLCLLPLHLQFSAARVNFPRTNIQCRCRKYRRRGHQRHLSWLLLMFHSCRQTKEGS